MTQVHYNRVGLVVDVEGSGTGLLRQGEVELLRCGDSEERVNHQPKAIAIKVIPVSGRSPKHGLTGRTVGDSP